MEPSPAIKRASLELNGGAAGVDAASHSLFVIHILLAGLTILCIAAHLLLRFAFAVTTPWPAIPLMISLAIGGSFLVVTLARELLRGRFSSDLLAGISIVTSVILGEYLAGSLVVLMLSGGEALEALAVRRASSALRTLARRMPSIAHMRRGAGTIDTVIERVQVGDELIVFPHETCPVDGIVTDGHGAMDESYLTGEPYRIGKAPGVDVISGAVNGETPLVIRATRRPEDSRYASIMKVMRETEQHRPRMRRIGDALGSLYTPIAVGIALLAWLISGDATRFLAVLVAATPCPLLIAIPVSIIGSISLAARRGIIVKDPAVLEQLATCETIFFDKTGTLTYGEPRLTEVITSPGFDETQALTLAASLEQYSKHPLASAVLRAASERGIGLPAATRVSEPAGKGLVGEALGKKILLTGRTKLEPSVAADLPPVSPGLECVLIVDGQLAAVLHFRDEPRDEVRSFIRHLRPRHHVGKLVLLTGDRATEADHLARRVGIETVYAEKSPEEKLAIVKEETARRRTAYLGDGVNDAPALVAATVGVAFGKASDVAAEAASAVILDSSLRKVDEFLHIGIRLRRIVLQSALGGMALSLVAVTLAAVGLLTPVAGALVQEAIDVFAVVNALRAARPPRQMSDM